MASSAPPPTIFNRQRRIARALRHYRLSSRDPSGQFLRADAAEDILERLAFMQVEPCLAQIHGDWPGFLGKALINKEFGIFDGGPDTHNEEQPYPDAGVFKLIVNLFALDTVNDLPGALLHIRNALPAGGIFFGCLTGAGSLPTLRQIMLAADGDQPAARLHPQIDNRAASALMQRAGFARQVVDTRRIEVSYRSFDQLVADLRAQGLNNVLADAPPPLTRAALERARAAFAALAGPDGRVTETFEILTLTGWH